MEATIYKVGDPAADYIQSATIDILRFPLAIAVIFIHMNPHVDGIAESGFDIFSWLGLYNILGVTFSHVLTHIAVPTFFLISGYLFFRNFDLETWSWQLFGAKIRSRSKTLILPYFSWNVTAFLLMVVYCFLYGMKTGSFELLFDFTKDYNFNILYDCNRWGMDYRRDWMGNITYMTGPYDLPLWFLRDLIVVCLCSPVIYYGIKRMKVVFMLLLFFAYISRIWVSVPGFRIDAFFFFSLGGFLSLNHINMVSLACRYRWFFVASSIPLLIVTVIYNGVMTPLGQNVYPFFIFATVFVVVSGVSALVEKYNLRPNKLLTGSCFFVYAFHAVPLPGFGSPLSFILEKVGILLCGDSGPMLSVTYMVTPFIAAGICVVIYMLMKRCFPFLSTIYTGSR